MIDFLRKIWQKWATKRPATVDFTSIFTSLQLMLSLLQVSTIMEKSCIHARTPNAQKGVSVSGMLCWSVQLWNQWIDQRSHRKQPAIIPPTVTRYSIWSLNSVIGCRVLLCTTAGLAQKQTTNKSRLYEHRYRKTEVLSWNISRTLQVESQLCAQILVEFFKVPKGALRLN